MDVLVVVVNLACWGTVIVLWIATAVRDSRVRRAPRLHGSPDVWLSLGAFIAAAAITRGSAAAPAADDGCRVGPAGSVPSSSSRRRSSPSGHVSRSDGRGSIVRRAAVEDGLRTDGPYAVTRHPIYTGLLGMMLGSALLGGLGQRAGRRPVVWIGIEVKIRSEERLLLATFPDAYRAYRERVPRLIPRWRPAGWRRDPE